jgi:hypothetical protein
MVKKRFVQMPRYIQIIGHISNMIIWNIPVIISIAVYFKIMMRGKNMESVSASIDKNRSQNVNTISAGIIIKRKRLNPVAQEAHNVAGLTLNVINEASSTSNTNDVEAANVEVIQIQDTEQNSHPDIPQSSSPQPRISSRELDSLLIIPSMNWTTFMATVFATILKFLIPTVTTISNFGPVRELMTVYLQSIFQP